MHPLSTANPGPAAGGSLVGRAIVVTRPIGEARSLTAMLEAAAARVRLCPAIEIEPIETPSVVEAAREALWADDAIFVSPSAIRTFFGLLARHGLGGQPFRPRAFTLGPGSARVLAALGVMDVLYPTGPLDSAGLLALPQLSSVAGRLMALIGGEGGRTELARTLVARGARLLPVRCYRRCRPVAPPLVDWLHEPPATVPDAIVITSTEGLHNLWASCDPAARERWSETLTVVPHARIAEAARALGLSRTILADAGDEGILAALERVFR